MSVRLNKKTKSWFVDIVYDYGKRFRKNSPENSKGGALNYEAFLRSQLAMGKSIERIEADTKPIPTFAQFSKKWLEVHVVPNNKFSEQKTKRSALKCWLLPFFGKKPLDQIGVRDIEEFKANGRKKGLSEKTVNNHLAVLSKCLSTAYDWKEMPLPPPKISWLKVPPPQTRHLSPDECNLLLSHCGGVLREMILTGLRTGMRQGELIALQWSSINWENQTIAVRHNQCYYKKELISTKNNRVRIIPMDVDVYETLYRRKKDTGYVFTDENNAAQGCRGLLARLKKTAKEAGIGNIGWHILRHTFASQLTAKGAPIVAVQTLLGHSSIGVTLRYAHVAPSTLRSAIDLLNPRNAHLRQPDGNEWQATQKVHALHVDLKR